MTGYIYLITDTTNGKQYVGQHHYDKDELDSNYHGSGHIIKMIYKKRPETLKEEYLKTCYSQEELDEWEKYFIFTFGTIYPNGYNLQEGGNGGIPCEEIRRKISEAKKGLLSGEKHPMFGKHHSDKSKKKMSEAKKGKHHSDETKQKMSEANKGKHLSDETKQKMSEAHQRRKMLKQLQPDGCLPLW